MEGPATIIPDELHAWFMQGGWRWVTWTALDDYLTDHKARRIGAVEYRKRLLREGALCQWGATSLALMWRSREHLEVLMDQDEEHGDYVLLHWLAPQVLTAVTAEKIVLSQDAIDLVNRAGTTLGEINMLKQALFETGQLTQSEVGWLLHQMEQIALPL